MPPNKSTDHRWQWFTDKVLPQLFVALVLAVSGGMWLTYTTVNTMVSRLENQQQEIIDLKADVAYVKATMVTKDEQLSTMKRIELYLDNMMLRAGVNPTKLSER